MAEGARLESGYTVRYRGFESLLLRHTYKGSPKKGPFFCVAEKEVMMRTLSSRSEPASGIVAQQRPVGVAAIGHPVLRSINTSMCKSSSAANHKIAGSDFE